jgi:hypothetical protein
MTDSEGLNAIQRIREQALAPIRERKQKELAKCAAHAERARDVVHTRNPYESIVNWLAANTIDNETAATPQAELIAAFNESRKAAGLAAVTRQFFGHSLHRLRPHVARRQRGPLKTWCYVGIATATAQKKSEVLLVAP